MRCSWLGLNTSMECQPILNVSHLKFLFRPMPLVIIESGVIQGMFIQSPWNLLIFSYNNILCINETLCCCRYYARKFHHQLEGFHPSSCQFEWCMQSINKLLFEKRCRRWIKAAWNLHCLKAHLIKNKHLATKILLTELWFFLMKESLTKII